MTSILRPFIDSTELLGDGVAVRRRLRDKGYLYFPEFLPVKTLTSLRNQIRCVLIAGGWVDPKGPAPLAANRPATIEGDEDYFAVYRKVQELEDLHRLPHAQPLRRVMSTIFDGPNFPHPLSIARLAFPNAEDFTTPAHQDHPNNQGTKDLIAAWIPLHHCATSRGPLEILAGSNKFGLLPVEYKFGAGAVRAIVDQRHEQLEWHGGDMSIGDVLLFHSLTVHRAAPNRSGEFRLSVDYRYQREGDALTAGCLRPHFGRQTWPEIYEGWRSTDLCYFWRKHSYRIADFDTRLRQPAGSSLDEALIDRCRFTVDQAKLARENNWPLSAELTKSLDDVAKILAAEPGDPPLDSTLR